VHYQVRARLAEIGEGKKVTIKYHHTRDEQSLRVVKGTLLKVVRRSPGSSLKLPSDEALVVSIDVQEEQSQGSQVASLNCCYLDSSKTSSRSYRYHT
jgi:hypothetical protein